LWRIHYNTNDAVVFYALYVYGYVYAAGFEYNGASGALADATNDQNITQNISKMQHIGGDASSSWARVYMPNTQHGKVIDIYLVGDYLDYEYVPGEGGDEYNPGNPGYYNYQNFQHGAFLTLNGSLLSCGSNVLGYRDFRMFPNQGPSVRVPQYHHGLGG
jgi:hypothetical protein